MAKKRKPAEGGTQNDDLAGTVEGLRRANFEREKAAYEERTGRRVKYEPGVPTTRTPLVRDEGRGTSDEAEGSPEEGASDEGPEGGEEAAEAETAEAEGEGAE